MKESIFIFLCILFFTNVKGSDTLTAPIGYPPLNTTSYKVYDVEGGLPVSCAEEIFTDPKGRLWVNPCRTLEMHKRESFYQFDGNKSYAAQFPQMDPKNPLSGSWFLTGITPSGLLFGTNLTCSHSFRMDSDTRKVQFYNFDEGEKIINVLQGEGDAIIVLTRSETAYTIYSISSKQKERLSRIEKDLREFSWDYTFAVKSGSAIWFLDRFDGFIRYGLSDKSTTTYDWKQFSMVDWKKDVKPIYILPNTKETVTFVKEGENKFYDFDPNTKQLSLNQQYTAFTNSKQIDQIFYTRSFNKDRNGNLLLNFQGMEKGQDYSYLQQYALLIDESGKTYDYTPVIKKGIQVNRYGKGFVQFANSSDFRREVILSTAGGLVAVEIESQLAIRSFLKGYASRVILALDTQNILVYADVGTFKHINLEKDAQETRHKGLSNWFCTGKINLSPQSQVIYEETGDIWLCTDKGLIGYNKNENSCQSYDLGHEFEKFNLLNDSEVIFVNLQHEVFIYNLEKNQLKPFLVNGTLLNIGGKASEVFIDREGNTWIASSNGLWKINQSTNAVIHFNIKNGLADDRVICMHEAKDGKLWIGMINGGLQIYDPKAGTFKLINQENGLSNNSVAAILEDEEGDKWVATFSGITVLSNNGEILFKLYEKDGISHKEFNRFSYHELQDGRFLFGSISGVNLLEPLKIKQAIKKENLYLYLTEIGFFDKKINKDTLIRNQLNDIRKINLAATHRYLILDFALSDYLNAENCTFAYQLISPEDLAMEALSEADWINVGNTSALYLKDLPPGRHTVLIRATDHKGQVLEEYLRIPIQVNEFFYKTWWFYLLCTLPFIVTGFLWSRSLVREKNRLEQEVEHRTREIKKDKEIIEQQAIKLQETDELKSRLFTNISHEFRTPLTIILGMVEQMEKQPNRLWQSGFSMIRKNGTNLLNLINQILELQKLESGKLEVEMQQGDILPFLQNIFDQFKAYAQSKEQNMICLSSLDELIIDYDQDKILRIISNILANAIKYTPKYGQITCKVSTETKPEINTVPCMLLSIQDTGAGIPEDQLPYIFDRYFQVSKDSKVSNIGTGIGLSLTMELVTLLNGTIEVDSKVGQGTTFNVFLPITNKAPLTNTINLDKIQAVIFGSKGPTNGIKQAAIDLPLALIIEDNPDIAHYLQLCLEGTYRMEVAQDGQAGIDKALTSIPDIIISDVMMPEKDGFEVCEALKEDVRTSHIPIILLTAKSDVNSRIIGLKHGADAYLSKPFNEEELQIRMENLLKIRRTLQERYINLYEKPIQKNEASAASKEDAFILNLTTVFEEKMSDTDFNVIALSKALNLSRSQLGRKVKALTGRTLSIYLRALRLQKAKQLLLSTDLSVKTIAYEVGFTHPSYFSATYIEEFGESPSNTREIGQVYKNS